MNMSVHRPSVGVVVPCYNYGRFLPECVQSAAEQEGVDVRILIIDNASTDDSAEVARALAARYPRTEVRVRSVNQTHIETYNEGLRWVSAKYAVVLSADDVLTPGSLQRACALLEAHPEVGFAYGRCAIWRDDLPRPPLRQQPAEWTIWSGHEWIEGRCQAAENCIHSPEVVARTSLLQRLGDYRIDLPHTADFELWMRLAAYADVGYVGGPQQAFYRDHSASMRHQRFYSPLAELRQLGMAFDILFRDHGEVIAEGRRLESLARRILARRALLAACRAYDRGQPPLSEVADLEQLALATTGDAAGLPEMRGLRWRRRLGVQVSRFLWPVLPPFVIPRLVRRARRELLRRSGW